MSTKVELSKFNNDWYSPGAGFVKRLLWLVVNTIVLNNSLVLISFVKVFALRLFGAKIGRGVVIKPSVNIKYPWNLEIGHHVWIGENVWIDCLDKVTIEDNVCVSQGALILSGNHNYKKNTFDLMIAPILIEEGVWIGAKTVVCQGVVCGRNSILTVGSVANKSLEMNGIYQGNPALKIRERKME